MKSVIFPGHFDPFTFGHMHILYRISLQFDQITLAIMENAEKQAWLSSKKRKVLIEYILKNHPFFSDIKLNIIHSSKSLIRLVEETKVNLIIRGIRSLDLINYELKMAKINRKLSNNKIETLFLLSDAKYDHIHSSLIKALIQSNFKNLKSMLPKKVLKTYLSINKHLFKKT